MKIKYLKNKPNSYLEEEKIYDCIGILFVNDYIKFLIYSGRLEFEVISPSECKIIDLASVNYWKITSNDSEYSEKLPEWSYGYKVNKYNFIGEKMIVENKNALLSIIFHDNYSIEIFKYYQKLFTVIKLDQHALVTSPTSQHKNRFLYIVKEGEQYFIFIKKSVDNDGEILDTIIFESQKETEEYIQSLEVQWLE